MEPNDVIGSLTTMQVAGMLGPHMHRSAWPGLDEPATRRRARAWLRKLGRWDAMTSTFAELPPLQPFLYRWSHMGRGSPQQVQLSTYIERIESLTLGAWVGHPAVDLAYYQDLLWLVCETSSWVPACEDASAVDLTSSRYAASLAEALYLLGDRLDPAVTQRVGEAIDSRVLRPALDCRTGDWWWTSPMNWNSVCNANVLSVALTRIGGYELSNVVHLLLQRLVYCLQGFSADGGCLEGTSYWEYGFGHYVDAAIMLHHRTGGQLNLMDSPKVAKICRFPLSTQLDGPVRAAFCDGGQGYIGADIALKINRFHKLPELYAISRRTAEGRLDVRGLRGLSIYRGERAGAFAADEDAFLPDMGLAKVSQRVADRRFILAALAGSNDVPHNHNDIGTFVYYSDGCCWLTDPGGPTYTDKTFSPQRYEILQCRTLGHSCPIVNGNEQCAGSDYRGQMEVEPVDQDGTKSVRIDMARAYPDRTLKQFERRFALEADGVLRLCDSFVFSRAPHSLEEAFVTYESARLVRGGRAVRIGGTGGVVLRADDTAGTFEIRNMGQESISYQHSTPMHRIVFLPERLRTDMRLAFVVTPTNRGRSAATAARSLPRGKGSK